MWFLWLPPFIPLFLPPSIPPSKVVDERIFWAKVDIGTRTHNIQRECGTPSRTPVSVTKGYLSHLLALTNLADVLYNPRTSLEKGGLKRWSVSSQVRKVMQIRVDSFL